MPARKFFIGISTALLLSGCINGTRVQQDYLTLRDECRDMAEANYDLHAPSTRQSNPALAAKDQGAVLAEIFSRCMYMNGWTVAAPGKRRSGRDPLIALNEGSKPAPSTTASAIRRPEDSPPPFYLPPAQAPLPEQRKPVNVQR